MQEKTCQGIDCSWISLVWCRRDGLTSWKSATKYGQIVETALKEKQLAAFPRTNKVLRRVMKSQSLQLPPKLDSLYFLGSKNWN